MAHNEEKILNKAVKKAEKNGWDKRGFKLCEVLFHPVLGVHGIRLSHTEEQEEMVIFLSVNDTIFSHDFARSLWGEKEACSNCGKHFTAGSVVCVDNTCVLNGHSVAGLPIFKFHLQQMVIQTDTLTYLGKHI